MKIVRNIICAALMALTVPFVVLLFWAIWKLGTPHQ